MDEHVTIYPDEITQRASELSEGRSYKQVEQQLMKEFPMTAIAAWRVIQRTTRIDDHKRKES